MLSQLGKRRPLPSEESEQRSLASTASRDWARLRQYAAYLERQCPGLPTTMEIYSQLRAMSRQFRDNFFAVCTESSTQPCQLLDKYEPWNRFLREINMELSEKEPGGFGLRCTCAWDNVEGKRRSYLLFHWLLKQHSCIKTLWIVEPFPPEYLHLFCDALHVNCGLEELVLLMCELDDEALKNIIPAIGTTLKGLVKLEMRTLLSSECALGSLGAALQKTSSLTSLNLYGIRMDARNAELLLDGLVTCPSLVKLSVQDYFLLPREGAALAELVVKSTALRQLSLTHTACIERNHLETFLKGLASNLNLEELDLRSFDLQKPVMDLLVETVANHSTLKVLEVSSHYKDVMDGGFLAELMACNTGLRELRFDSGKAECVAAFARAICKNTRLEKLQLTLIGMEVHDYRELLMAVACNQSLRELEFRCIPDVLLGDVCQLMQETGTEGRVKFEVDFGDALVFTTAIKKCSRLTQMSFSPVWHGIPLPRDMFSELIHYHQLRELTVFETRGSFQSECLVDLALFLSRTTTLKKAHLRFLTTAETTTVLLDAISQNWSISRLWICEWTFRPRNLRQLYDIIRSKKELSFLHLELTNCSERRVMHSLAEPLCSSLSLLDVTVEVDHRYRSHAAQERIRAATRRNSSTLHRAVKFVMGSRGRRFAEAFERIFGVASLVEAVQKRTSETEEQAKEMVKSSKRYLDCNFLAAVGVVKDTVVCEPNGSVQLDCIGFDNWLQIRQYLKVADIKPEPVEGFCEPSLHQKRGRLN